jgi:hypothetical protein
MKPERCENFRLLLDFERVDLKFWIDVTQADIILNP